MPRHFRRDSGLVAGSTESRVRFVTGNTEMRNTHHLLVFHRGHLAQERAIQLDQLIKKELKTSLT